MKTFLAIITFCLLCVASACYTSKKVTRSVNVSINSNFEVVFEKDAGSHFIDNYTADEYKKVFIEGLTKQLGYKNIIVVTENPEFIITIGKLLLKESLTTDTIKDPKSPDYKKVYDITKLLVQSTGTVASAPDGKKWESFTADRSDREKLTNLFPIGAKVGGEKPGPNDWRKKGFDNYEFRDNVSKVGERTGDVITNRVNRFLK